jgi:hypothetical protein
LNAITASTSHAELAMKFPVVISSPREAVLHVRDDA